MNIRQLKLVTGEELMCEVLDEHESDIVVRNALTLKLALNEQGKYFYQFKPFMSFQDNPIQAILIVCDKILSLANPSPELISYYEGALQQLSGEDPDVDDVFIDTNYDESIDSDNAKIYH